MLMLAVYALAVGILGGMAQVAGRDTGAWYTAGLVLGLVGGLTWASGSLQLVGRLLKISIWAATVGGLVGATIGGQEAGLNGCLLGMAGGAAGTLTVAGWVLNRWGAGDDDTGVEGETYLMVSLGAAVLGAIFGPLAVLDASANAGYILCGGLGGGLLGAFGAPMSLAREGEDEGPYPG